MDPRERLVRALRAEGPDRTPVISPHPFLTDEALARAGLGRGQASSSAGAMALAAKSAMEATGLECLRAPFNDMADAKRAYGGGADVTLEAAFLLRKGNPDAPLIIGVAAPFTLACLSLGREDSLRELTKKPHLVEEALTSAQAWSAERCGAAARAGADVVLITDPMAAPEVLDPGEFARLALPGLMDCAKAVKSSNAVAIVHVPGETAPPMDLLRRSGADGVALDENASVVNAKRALGRASVIGSIPPASLMFHSAAMIMLECREALADGVDALAPGGPLETGTRSASIKAMLAARDAWRP